MGLVCSVSSQRLRPSNGVALLWAHHVSRLGNHLNSPNIHSMRHQIKKWGDKQTPFEQNHST